MRRLRLAVVLLFATSAVIGEMTPVTATLPNGLRVVVVENHAVPVVAVRIYIRAGSMYEGKLLGHGMAHYLEHTISKGTPTRTAAEIDSIIESLGNDSNAYTSRDHCCYYINTATPYWQTALDVLADYVFNATFPEAEVKIQQGVILREMARTNDDIGDRLYWLFAETMFLVHPCRYRIIGYPERFVQITREDIVAYHAAYYVPDNAIVSIAGDVESETVIATCREKLASIPRRPPPPMVLPAEPTQNAPRRRLEIDDSLQRAYLQMGYRSVDLLSPDMYPLDVLSYVLGHGASSRLVRSICENQQLVDSISCYSDTPAYDAGVFGVFAVLDAKNVEAAETAILAEIQRARTELITPVELERAKTQKAAELVFALQTAESQAEVAAIDLLTTGDPTFSQTYVERIRKVTREDVRRVAQQYLRPEKLCVVVLTPQALKREKPGGEASEKPETVVKTLHNGLRVIVQHSSTVPMVSICTAAKGGLRFETAENNGITEFMSDMMVRGTTKHTREELAQAVEDLGASLAPYSGRNSFGVQATALSQDFEQILGYVADVLMNATFPEEEFEKERQFTLAAIRQQEDNPNTVARRLFNETFFTVHPYRFLTTGTEASITRLTRQQVAEYYSRYCRPERTVLAVFGDVEPEAAFVAVERALGKWQPALTEDQMPPVEPALTEVREVSKERKQEQAIITLGFPGVTVQDPRRYAIDVLDAILSGCSLPGGRLHDALRRSQLVYYVHAWSEPGLDPGAFVVQAATDPAKTKEALHTIKQVLTTIQSEIVDEAELARGKQMCIVEHEMNLQTPASRAQQATLDELYGLGYDNYTRYVGEINKITALDVQLIARELLDLRRCVITVLGPPVQSGGESL
ncbi:MAG: M16 family metallopeptidase [Candidatus Zipacnadales bacterium]